MLDLCAVERVVYGQQLLGEGQRVRGFGRRGKRSSLGGANGSCSASAMTAASCSPACRSSACEVGRGGAGMISSRAPQAASRRASVAAVGCLRPLSYADSVAAVVPASLASRCSVRPARLRAARSSAAASATEAMTAMVSDGAGRAAS